MHPWMMWKHMQRHAHAHGHPGAHGEEAFTGECQPGPGFGRRRGPSEEEFSFGSDGGEFGVRRPLRYLSHHLELDEAQVAELAVILDTLKVERAQAEVDRRRSVSGLADAVSGETFDAARAAAAGTQRVQTAEKLKQAVTEALGKLHALLKPEQRKQLAYLLRTGQLAM